MGVRFNSTIISQRAGTTYFVEIIDTTYGGATTTITLDYPGFELKYLQQGDERFVGIKGSELALNLMVTNDATGTALETWINSTVLATKEDQYFISVKKNGSLWWYGVILPDLNDRQDHAKPYTYQLNATDGLARLADYDYSHSADNTPITFAQILWSALERTPLYTNGGQTLLFSTVCEWYEDQMHARDATIDPLGVSRISEETFAIKKEGETPYAMSYYDVLNTVCETWGMRLMLTNGLFKFIQVNAYEASTTSYERFYRRDTGAYHSYGSFTGYAVILNNSTAWVMAGNLWKYYPPLKYVILKYPFINTNMLDTGTTLNYYTLNKYDKTLPDSILGGTNVYLNFYTALQVFIDSALTSRYTAKIVIEIKVGSNYLKRDPLTGIISWSASSLDRYVIYVGGLTTSSNYTNIPLSLATPDIPAGTHSTNYFSIEVIYLTDELTGTLYYYPTSYAFTRLAGTTSLLYNSSSSGNESSFYEYIARNTNTNINSYNIDCPETIIGEPFNSIQPGGLEVYTGSAWVKSTAQWRLQDTGATYYDFNLLRVKEVLSGQTLPTRKYIGGAISSSIDPQSSVEYDGYRHILNGGTYNPNSESWDAEWFAVSLDRSAFDPYGPGVLTNGNGGNQEMRLQIGGVSNRVGTLENSAAIGWPLSVTVISSNTTGASKSEIFVCTSPLNFTPPTAAGFIVDGKSIIISVKNASTGVGDSVTFSGSIDLSTGNHIIFGECLTLFSDGTNIWTK